MNFWRCHKFPYPPGAVLLFTALLSASDLLGNGTFDLRLQVAAGDSAPGLQASTVFHSILEVRSNDRNQILFSATVGESEPSGLSSRSPWGLFLQDQGGVKEGLLEGDTLPGGEKVSISALPEPAFATNNTGAVAIIDPQRGVLLYQDR